MKKSGRVSAALVATLLMIPSIGLAQEDARPQPTPEQIAREVQNNSGFIARNALSKAQSLLEYYDDFAPFGLALFPSGQIKYVWAIKPGENIDNINGPLVLNSVRTALASQASNGIILGSAVVYKYQSSDEGADPQINIEIEYFGGFAQVLATHFSKTDEGYEYSEGVFGEFDSIVFAPQTAPEESE
ncbi:hypothetical protein [Marinobacter mobilis]|uniref:Uncharacterized protein n=1 Tax=Marinobacter mobilis TaxID=488533 RepID=A0A1H2V2B9_9GAMM|nr:hypothetical protein [Marinobacter mobilis]SDW62054.1 hypothetical protein SAMN04487960_103296 [Marinobacter mobilis]